MGRVPLDHHHGSETQGRGAPVLGAGLAQASPRLWSGGQGWGRLDVGPASTQDPLEVRATRVHWQPAKAGAPSRKCSASSLAAGGPGDQGRGEPACGDLRPSRTWGLPGTGPSRARPAPRGLGPGGTRGPLWAGACPPPRRPGAPSRPGRALHVSRAARSGGGGGAGGRAGLGRCRGPAGAGARARRARRARRPGRGARAGEDGERGLQFQASAGDADPQSRPLLLLGQLHHLHRVPWSHVRGKLQPRVTEEVSGPRRPPCAAPPASRARAGLGQRRGRGGPASAARRPQPASQPAGCAWRTRPAGEARGRPPPENPRRWLPSSSLARKPLMPCTHPGRRLVGRAGRAH